MNNNLKVVFFDMGNTLLHFHFGKTDEEKDTLGLKYLTDFLNKLNPKIKYEDIKSNFFDIWQRVMPLRKKHRTEYPVENYLNDFLKKYEIKLDLDMCIKAMNAFYTDYRNNVWFEADLYETLDTVRRKGYRIGVISNACLYDEVFIDCFNKAGIDELIDSFTFSYYLKVGKPEMRIFEAAMKKMLVNPNEAIMIGDNLLSDIEPTQKLGLKGIWYNKEKIKNNTHIKPDIEINQIKDLLEYI